MNALCGASFTLRGALPPLLLLLATLPLLSASKPTVQTLMAADEEFCRDFTARGVEGWLAHFADDAVVFSADGPITRDRKALEAHYRKLFAGKVPLTWKPLGGEIAASGDLGFTYGTWLISGETPRTGKYQTIWKKQRDGSWKIVADIGNPDEPGRRTQ
jgi:ketosteroid isomerase-like protein